MAAPSKATQEKTNRAFTRQCAERFAATGTTFAAAEVDGVVLVVADAYSPRGEALRRYVLEDWGGWIDGREDDDDAG